jgi:hypothetical protein
MRTELLNKVRIEVLTILFKTISTVKNSIEIFVQNFTVCTRFYRPFLHSAAEISAFLQHHPTHPIHL